MSNHILPAMLTVGLCLVTGCFEFKFGDDTELQGLNVTAQHLQEVSSLTGIRFPDGSTGLAYLYLGSGIDDALAVKVAIPANQKDAFLQNEIFHKGREEVPHIEIGKSKAWWKIDSLTDRNDRSMGLPEGRFLECTFGVEDGEWVAYISWMST